MQHETFCTEGAVAANPPLPTDVMAGCVSLSVQGRGFTLRCSGVLALSISVLQPGRQSNVEHSTAVMDLLLKPSRCAHKGAVGPPLTMTP